MTQQTMIPIIRTGRIVDKCLKGKNEVPTLVIKEQNGGKIAVPINSGSDIDEDFKIGQEVRIRIEQVPHRFFDEPKQATEEKPFATTTVSCLLGVTDEDKGKVAVCQGCPSLKSKEVDGQREAYCEKSSFTGPDLHWMHTCNRVFAKPGIQGIFDRYSCGIGFRHRICPL